MLKQLNLYIIVLFLLLAVQACNTTKFVPEGDKLYTGASIKTDSVKLDKDLKLELDQSLKPKPNGSFLGIKFKLMLFNMFKEPKKKKGLIYKFKYKLGEPPVLLSQVNTKAIEKKLASQLFNKGWLRSVVTSEQSPDSSKVSVKYLLVPGTRYTINNIYFPSDSSGITAVIKASAEKTLLKKGEFLNLETIRAETERIDLYLKENGYFFFEPGNLLVKIDSLHAGKADLYVTIKEGTNKNTLKPWKLGEVLVYSNYVLESDSLIQKQQGNKYKGFWLIDRDKQYKPSVFDKVVLMQEDSLYKRYRHSLTIERLMNLNTFKFVRIAFTPQKDTAHPVLNTKIFLTPTVKNSVRLEAGAYSKSTSYVGTELSLNYRNVNVFKGAEILELKLTGGFDWQVGGQQASPNQQLFTAELNFYIPKLIPAFPVKLKRNPFIPRTIFSAATEYLRKPDLYLLRSLKFGAGYNWKEGKAIEHNIKLINVNYIYPTNITPKFDSMMADDVTLRAAFEKQLVIGSRYQFQYNNSYRTGKKFHTVFLGNLVTAGNLASLFIKTDVDTVGAKKLFNVPISQFIKIETELRTYLQIKPKWLLASRAIAGIVFGYGNSSVAPYAEQFYIGGTSSIRAFRIRTLGPGSYHTEKASYDADESGEIKFECNGEIRHDLSKYVKLAFFIDAGNIWLRKDAIDKPGSGFDKRDFFKEMAVGSGLGLRIDASVLVIRFDFAIPLRKPWYPEGKRWVFNEIDPGDSQWRKDNLILNIGIGYPF